MIQVKNLSRSYGERRAVDQVSFAVERGSCFGLLGPNGAGKTTTIRMLVGDLVPDGGEILLAGSHSPRTAEARRLVGLAPQSLAIYEELTAEENLRFMGRLQRLEGRVLAERVDRVLEMVGLQDRRRDRAARFSGGMKRRLNLACALVHEPEILFLDEPTVGVDPQSRNWIFDNINTLKAAGTTIVYTTHYMEEAERLCDLVAIMDGGRIVAQDTVDGLICAHGGLSTIAAELADGERISRRVADPCTDLAELARAGREIVHLQVDRPDLEAVFLNLTGRSLRD